jgi:predicted Rossmann fold flavoprotein
MMCALTAGARGRRVALLEHAEVIGRKIRISGGGRCNFTNLGAGPEQYVSANPHFARSALARYTPEHFLQLVRAHGIAFHEKKFGQLFCDHSAQALIDMLVAECRQAGVVMALGCQVRAVAKAARFTVQTNQGAWTSKALVIATGGLSLPKIGATDLGYRLARQFGLQVLETAPALDAFVFAAPEQRHFQALAGVSLPAGVRCGETCFREQVLFTHTGLSGPAALQASLYWRPGQALHVDWLPEHTLAQVQQWLAQRQRARPRADVKTVLAEQLPKRAAERFCALSPVTEQPIAQQTKTALETLGRQLKEWSFIPQGTVGYRTAEVTRGGVDTRELSSKTMEAKKVPGLYFIGEVVDVTGWLGGYNFQWAWASGWAAGQAV